MKYEVTSILSEGKTIHEIFDEQNVGGHKITIYSVFILFKMADFRTMFLFRGKVYRWKWGGVTI